MTVGTITYPYVDGEARLAKLLDSLASVGFTFTVEPHATLDCWSIKLQR